MSAITPGLVADLSNDEYHAMTDWLSSTQLKTLLPEHYKAGGSTEALSFGSLFHTVVLEPERVDLDYVALDAEVVGVKQDGTKATNPTSTTAWKNALAEAEKLGRTVVSEADLAKAYAMRDALLAHDTAPSVLFGDGSRFEVSAFAVDENGVKHKARFDSLGVEAADLKSTAAKPGIHSLTKVVVDYGYDLSAAHYLAVAELAGVQVEGPFSLVFVSKEAPHRVTVCDLDEQFIKRGMALRELAIERALGKSEPYEGATGRLTLFCPEWAIPFEEMELS